jgi:hypothetical protein
MRCKAYVSSLSEPFILTTQCRLYLDQVILRRREFEQFLQRRKGLSNDEKRCFQHASINEASEYWIKLAHRTISDHEQEHDSGWRFWARSAETAAVAASQFMFDLKPLLDAAASSSPEAGLSIGIISGFFALVSSKPRMDDLIVQEMADVLERLPGFRMLETIYQQYHPQQALLRRKIYLAFHCVVDFAITATRYYLKSGLARWWVATFNPSRLTDLTETIHKTFFQVRRKSEELLVLAVDDLREDNEKARLSRIRSLLSLRQWSEEDRGKKLLGHKQNLEQVEKRLAPLDWMSESKIVKFRQRKDFCEWEASTDPQMFLIIAAVDSALYDFVPRYCWMSPLALSVIEEHCHTSEVNQRQKEGVFSVLDIDVRPSVHDLVSELLFGLLRLQGSFDPEEVSAKLETYREARRTGSDGDGKRALKAAASTVVHCLSRPTPLYIVIDQIHWCQQRWDLLEVLLHVLDTALEENCCIKIFAVAHKMHYPLPSFQLDELARHPLVQTCTMTQMLSSIPS